MGRRDVKGFQCHGGCHAFGRPKPKREQCDHEKENDAVHAGMITQRLKNSMPGCLRH